MMGGSALPSEPRSMTTLYVIGNGFDLHHGMATSYKHFGEFLKRDYPKLRDLLDDYFPTYNADDFWGHFEERLADFDADTLVENSEHLIVSYNADHWRESYNHDYSFELDRVVEAVSTELLRAFGEWIRQIVIPSPGSLTVSPARIDPTARFINFNYTATLQRLYGVPKAHIWHVHGAADGSDPLVLGHAWRPKPAETRTAHLDPEREDTRVLEGAQTIDQYFKRTFKPTAKIIADNAGWFASLADVDDIRVLGHSLSDVDLPYLETIVASARPTAQWRCSFHDASAPLEAQFTKFAPAARPTFAALADV